MKSNYSYLKQVAYMDSISVDDIGNCILEAYNDLGDQYYLIIRTVLGVSRIFQIGPLQQDATTFCSCYFQQMDYNDNKIDKLISKFVDSKDITQITVYDVKTREDIERITNSLPDIKEFMYD